MSVILILKFLGCFIQKGWVWDILCNSSLWKIVQYATFPSGNDISWTLFIILWTFFNMIPVNFSEEHSWNRPSFWLHYFRLVLLLWEKCMQKFLLFTDNSFHWNRHKGVCFYSPLKLTQDYPLISGIERWACKLQMFKIVTLRALTP